MGMAKEHTKGSQDLERTLSGEGVHQTWESAYRSAANEAFYETAFDTVAELFGGPGRRVLDAGCGPGAHSVRLGRRGFSVTAVDFSPAAVAAATARVTAAGLTDVVTVQRQSLLALGFADASFDGVMCWGVLMHVAEIDQALDELCRVVRPGGTLVLSETNLASLEARVYRLFAAVARRGRRARRVDAGIERWVDTDDGPLLIRQADIAWLVAQCKQRGFRLTARLPGQFTETYAYLPGRAAAAVHRLNTAWFTRVGWPGPALGNVFAFERVG
jgi:ubiquinone/menaquinone biosynthesis C-methylase UbiE